MYSRNTYNVKVICVLLFTMALLLGCAIKYRPPQNETSNYSTPHQSKKAMVLAKTKKVLIQEGFYIQSSDDASGLVSTAPKQRKLKPEQANCGKTMALNYLHDPRTTTDVAFDVVVDDVNLTIHSKIQGQYKASALDESMILTCVSHGSALERSLAYKILN